jgi:hypothetical protein
MNGFNTGRFFCDLCDSSKRREKNAFVFNNSMISSEASEKK